MTQTDTANTPTPKSLPPYSGHETLCAKCSHLEALTRFRPEIGHPQTEEYNGQLKRRGPLPERLERQCMRCDYQWDEALNPAPGGEA